MRFKQVILLVLMGLLVACKPPPLEVEALVYETPREIKPFNLTDQHANAVGLDDLKGQWDLLFLGYTSCPDVCPMTLAKLQQVTAKLQRDDVNVWFVSVDPARDTVAKRLQYISYFNSQFKAVTGEHKDLFPFVQNLGLMYALAQEQVGDYFVDHSASVALVDPQGQIRAIFKPEYKKGSVPTINTNKMVHDLRAILAFYES